MDNANYEIICPKCGQGIPLRDTTEYDQDLDYGWGVWKVSVDCPRCLGTFSASVSFNVVIDGHETFNYEEQEEYDDCEEEED